MLDSLLVIGKIHVCVHKCACMHLRVLCACVHMHARVFVHVHLGMCIYCVYVKQLVQVSYKTRMILINFCAFYKATMKVSMVIDHVIQLLSWYLLLGR